MKHILDHDLIIAFLNAIEERVDLKGWNQDPQLFAFFEEGDALAYSNSGVSVDGPPENFVSGIANAFEATPHLSQRLAQNASLRGIGLLSEAWGIEKGFQAAQMVANKQRVCEHTPGRFEARFLIAVDIWGRLSYVERKRGEEPTASKSMRGSGVAMSLIRILRALAPFSDCIDEHALVALQEQLKKTSIKSPLDML